MVPRQRGVPSSQQFIRGAALAATGAVLDRALSGKILQDIRFLKSIVNAEKNYLDTSAAMSGAVTPSAVLLTGIAEGDDVATRHGRSLKCAGFEFRYHAISATAATTPQVLRMILIKDNDPNGAAPTITQVLVASTVDSPANLAAFQGRFEILYDQQFVLGTVAGSDGGVVIDVELPLKHHISFIGTGATVASSGQGNLFAFCMADQVATNPSAGAFYSRLRFYDN